MAVKSRGIFMIPRLFLRGAAISCQCAGEAEAPREISLQVLPAVWYDGNGETIGGEDVNIIYCCGREKFNRRVCAAIVSGERNLL